MPSPDKTLDNFAWSKEGISNDRIIYFDQKGNCVEKAVPKGILEGVLKIFDGKPRSIRRTSGGLSLCEPHQLVIYDRTILEPHTLWKPDAQSSPIVRIRVKFHDLMRDKSGLIVGTETALQTKIVLPHDILEAFTVKADSTLTLVDVGNGIVPISIFYVENKGPESMAYFTEPDALKTVQNTPKGKTVPISVYQIPVKAVRVPDGDNSFDIARAQDNLQSLLQRKEPIAPEVLRLSTPMTVPTGKSESYIKSCLIAMLDPKIRFEVEPILARVVRKEEAELLPFGVFEAP